jgi:hypothetical protein
MDHKIHSILEKAGMGVLDPAELARVKAEVQETVRERDEPGMPTASPLFSFGFR